MMLLLFLLKEVIIVSIKGSDCRIHFIWYMSKDDAIENSNLNETSGLL